MSMFVFDVLSKFKTEKELMRSPLHTSSFSKGH